MRQVMAAMEVEFLGPRFPVAQRSKARPPHHVSPTTRLNAALSYGVQPIMTWTPPASARDSGQPLLMLLGVLSLLGFPASWFLPPPIISVAVAVALGVVGFQVMREVSSGMPALPYSQPLLGYPSAFLAAVPIGFVSIFCSSFAATSSLCVMPTPGESAPICDITTQAENVSTIAWLAIATITAIFMIVGMFLRTQSRTAARAAYPILLAGCTIAFDLSHCAALAIGTEHP